MADNTKGIMALPANDQPQQDISLDQSYDAIRGGLHEASPQASMMVQNQLNSALPSLDALSDEQIDAMLKIIQFMMGNEDKYAEIRKYLIERKVFTEDQLPEEFDPELLSTIGMMLMEAKRQRSGTQQPQQGGIAPPKQFKKGGLAKAAKEVAKAGRYGDTMLAHINKDEAALLKARGGSGTINPETGLPEYWSVGGFIGSVVDTVSNVASAVVAPVVDAAKEVAKTPVGKLLATAAIATFAAPALGITGLAGSMALGAAGTTALSGGNIQDILKSGATAYLAAALSGPLGEQIGKGVGVTSAAGQAALGAGVAATGISALTGTKLSDAVKQGLLTATLAGAVTGYQKGFDTPAPVKDMSGSSLTSVDAKSGQATVNVPNTQTTVAGQPAAGPLGVDMSSGVNPSLVAEAQRALAESPTAAQIDASKAYQWNPYTGLQETTVGNLTAPESWNTQGNAGYGGTPTATTAGAAPSGNILTDTWDKTKSLYNEYLSPSGRAQAALTDAKTTALKEFNTDIANGVPREIALQNYQATLKAATPGVISTYGPMVAAGLGITGLMGGYKPQQPAPSALQTKLSGTPGEDLIRANPRQYIPQNIAGIQYDASGNIVGSQPWTPAPSGPVEIASNAMPYVQPSPGNQLAPMYSVPTGAATNTGIAQVAQPYNTPASYYEMMNRMRQPVRFAADGGYMSSAFPMSPLTSDRGPLMAQVSSPVSMNTPGVPMNVPMQYAVGGIASLATGGYPRRTGQISGPGTETSDDIPAMLSDGEFVMTARAVRGAGKGDRRAGAKKMYALMHQLEKNAARG